LLAAQKQNGSLSKLFAQLPPRFTGGGLIDNVPEDQIQKFRTIYSDKAIMQRVANQIFGESGLGQVTEIDVTDGLRLTFETGDVIHLRPSGNAPQFRVYSNASSQKQANHLADAAIAPRGYIMQLLKILETLPA